MPFSAVRAELGRERRIADDNAHFAFHRSLFAQFKKTACVDGLFLQRWEKFNTHPNLLRL